MLVRLGWWGCAGAAVLVRLGIYRVGGQITGQLRPAPTSMGGDPGQTRIFSYLLCPEKQIGGASYFSEWYDWRAEL
ncbi:hypothetical protein ACFOPQ_12495 [Deinococcus antarcticus]|uniref:Uncharacterized protein n=1 Tax=Deinococcus antarcticus TaxID=1298767 RepID=A0ABV8AAX2_9DEIO